MSGKKTNDRTSKTSMTKSAAARIQRDAAKSGSNSSFARRAQRAADRNQSSASTRTEKKGR